VDAHGQAVRNFLRRICPNTDEADDLAQDTFITAWTTLRGLKDPARFQSWIMGIAWRKAKSRTRSMARTRARETEWQINGETGTGQINPDEALALRQAMAELAPEPRAAIALCLGAGMSHSEVANALSLPLGTVKSHVARSRARLAAILGVNDE
jgi:RNA polymerase sigma-70 factor (ECF subfamily)